MGEPAFLNWEGRKIPTSQVILAHQTQAGGKKFSSTVAREYHRTPAGRRGVRVTRDERVRLIQASPLAIISTNAEGASLAGMRRRSGSSAGGKKSCWAKSPPVIPEDWQGRFSDIHGRRLRGDLGVASEREKGSRSYP